MKRILFSLLVVLYSLFTTVLFFVARLIRPYHKELSYQLKDRVHPRKLVQKIAHERKKFTHSYLFFCSSAGEFEQAQPLIETLKKHNNAFIQIVFHSQSGFDFAKVRNESESYCLAPPDTVWHWGWLFSAVRPDRTFVIRYELWPAFLETASRYSELYLVNAGAPNSSSKWSTPRRFLQRQLTTYFDKIFVLEDKDRSFYIKELGAKAECVTTVGDTKYDRVRQSALGTSHGAQLDQIRTFFKGRKIFILGSSYQEDIELVVAARARAPELSKEWGLLVVPHQLNPEHLKWVEDTLEKERITACRLSQPNNSGAEALIVDQMGLLSALYSLADIAWIGGALHNRVHNVLEAAVHGLPIAFGPHYHTSAEARKLVEHSLALSTDSATSLLDWWQTNSDDKNRQMMLEHIDTQVGATDRILERI